MAYGPAMSTLPPTPNEVSRTAEDGARPDRVAWGLERPALGLSLGGTHGPDQARAHREWVDRAESLGLHSVWLPEMHFQPGVCPAPLIELAGYAARTRRIRLATTSLLLPLHPPDEIATEIATLDRLSGGRLLIGLGRGFQRPMLEAFGVPPAEKRDRFDDALDRMLALWGGHNARAEAGDGASAWTVQRPHPPLAVAAFGPKGLAQAARRALPYLASPIETFEQIAENQARHRAALPDPSRPALSLVMRTVFVSDRPEELEHARASLEREMGGRRRGMPQAVGRALDAPLEQRAIVGTPEEVRERLRAERARLEIDLLVCRPQIRGLDPSALARSLERLATEIWPDIAQPTP
jgi:alkanesulfonate monooxygenase SsuD/methylene tetrahydromethanopterin reductase-like flavin-dependent oxidoreductase (luciferase family)